MSQARSIPDPVEAQVTALVPNAPAPAGVRPKPRRPVPKKSRAWIAWVVVLLALAGGGIGYWRYALAHRGPDVIYKTVPAEVRTITGQVKATGTLQAVVTVQVGSVVSGRIMKLYADYNSHVKKGELIAKLDPQLFQAQVQQASANYVQSAAQLVQAQATLLNADRTYKREKALHEQSLATQQDLETAETALAVAKSGIDVARGAVEQARAQLNVAKVNLSYTDIYSPIDGSVISRSVDVGQTVAASLQAPVLFTIAEDLKKMQVNTNVTEGDVGRLQEGQKTYFTVDAFPGQRFYGTISQIRNSAATVQNVVTYDAVIDVENDDLRLRPGMTANVTVTYDRREDALAVPVSALRFRPPPPPGASGGRHHGSHGGGNAEAAGSASAGGEAKAPSGQRHHRSDGEGGEAKAKDLDKDDKAKPKEVYVLRGDKPVAVKVETGLTDSTWVEITSGELSEGDQVITDANQAGAAPRAAPTTTGRTPRMF